MGKVGGPELGLFGLTPRPGSCVRKTTSRSDPGGRNDPVVFPDTLCRGIQVVTPKQVSTKSRQDTYALGGPSVLSFTDLTSQVLDTPVHTRNRSHVPVVGPDSRVFVTGHQANTQTKKVKDSGLTKGLFPSYHFREDFPSPRVHSVRVEALL